MKNRKNKFYDEVTINDVDLLEILANRRFHNSSFPNDLVEIVNKIFFKYEAAYFVTEMPKNKLLVLGNRQEKLFYLFLCPVNGRKSRQKRIAKTRQIIGDMITGKKNGSLWRLIYMMFNDRVSITPSEFISRLSRDRIIYRVIIIIIIVIFILNIF